MRDFLRRRYPYIILLLVSLIPFWVNVSHLPSDAVLNLRDFDTPINIDFDFYVHYYLWNSNWGFGLPNAGSFILLAKNIFFSFFNHFHIPLIYIEKIYVTVIFFSLGWGGYYFTTNYFTMSDDRRRFAGLMAGLFYMFSIPVYTRFIGVPHILIGVAMYPVLIILLLKVVYSKDLRSVLKYSALSAITSLFALTAGPSLAYLYMPALIFFPLMHVVIDRKILDFKRVVYGMVIVSLLSILVNLWWLSPILYGLFGSKELARETIGHSHNVDVFTIANNLVSFFDNLRLHWTKNGFNVNAPDGTPYFSPDYIKRFYSTPFSYAVYMVFIAFGVYTSFKSRQNKKQVIVISLLGLISLFFTLGTHIPVFGRVHQFFFYNIPGFQVLRNFFKFQYLVLLWYASLMFFLSVYLLEKLASLKRLRALAFIVLAGFIVSNALPFTAKDLAGRHEYFKIPKYYTKTRTWLREHNKDIYRIFMIPQGTWEETYEWGPKFELVPMHRNFFRGSILLMQEPDDVMKFIDPVLGLRVRNLKRYLQVLNVRYIMIRRDIYKVNLRRSNAELIRRFPDALKAQGILLEKSFGKLDLYRVPEDYTLPHIYAASGVVPVTAGSDTLAYLADTPHLADNPALIFTDDLAKPAFLATVSKGSKAPMKGFVFSNRDYRDFILELALMESENSARNILRIKTPALIKDFSKWNGRLDVREGGQYVWYIRSRSGWDREKEIRMEFGEDQVTKKPRNVPSRDGWVRLGEWALGDGRVGFRIEVNGKIPGNDTELLVISRKKLEGYRDMVIKRPESYLFYVDREEVSRRIGDAGELEKIKLANKNPFEIGRRRFYLPDKGDYSVRAYIRPRRKFARSGSIFNDSIGTDLAGNIPVQGIDGWRIGSINAAYTRSMTDEGMLVDAYFKGGGAVKEAVYLKKKFNGVKLTERPFLAFYCEVGYPATQAAEIEIKFKYPGYLSHVGESKKIVLPAENWKNVIDLYRAVSDRFGMEDADKLLVDEVVLRFKKRDGVDVSGSETKRTFPFIFKNFSFLNIDLGETSLPDSYYYYSGVNGEVRKANFTEEVPDDIKDIYRLEIANSIDLRKTPFLSFTFPVPKAPEIYQRAKKRFPSQWNVVLILDFDGDELQDMRLTTRAWAGLKGSKFVISTNALDEVEKRFPARAHYNLLSVQVSLPDGRVVFSQRVKTRRLVRFTLDKGHTIVKSAGKPVLRVNGSVFIIPLKAGVTDTEGGLWLDLGKAELKRGENHLSVSAGEGFSTEMVEFTRTWQRAQGRQTSVKIKTRYNKINPTKYVVDISNANGPFALVFAEKFHPGWKAYITDGSYRVDESGWMPDFLRFFKDHGVMEEVDGHFTANGYANAWIVKPDKASGAEGKLQVLLEYRPQRIFEAFLDISLGSFVLSLLYLGFEKCTRRRRR
ncbi:MAG: hypothetical protein BMS9Abin23_0442 [Thermodesulfobacteriota bacterium]|nr:MAG: hypothetical protein BMS9Abin23_0442 [Thermodesulfobacteriota bacterium]